MAVGKDGVASRIDWVNIKFNMFAIDYINTEIFNTVTPFYLQITNTYIMLMLILVLYPLMYVHYYVLYR